MKKIFISILITMISFAWKIDIMAIDWYRTILEDGYQIGVINAIGIDKKACPHIIYYRAYRVRHAYQDTTGNWQFETVIYSNLGGFGRHSLDFDSKNQIHISFHHHDVNSYEALKYAYKDDSGWHDETIDNGYIYSTTIKIDKNDFPHIVYCIENNTLKYAFKNENGWNYQIIAANANEGILSHKLFDFNQQDRPCVTYIKSSGTTNDLMFARLEETTWNFETVVSNLGSYPGDYAGASIEIDKNNYAHIVYNTGNKNTIKYAFQSSIGWNYETIATVKNRGAYPCIDLDNQNYPHVCYFNEITTNEGYYNYAYKNSDGWHIETASKSSENTYSNRDWGYSSIALNDNDDPHISYYGFGLRFARPQDYGPGPFSLVSPLDRTSTSPQPTFRWQAASYNGNGLTCYELWIDHALNKGNIPPYQVTTTVDNPLSYGWHNWKVKVVLSGGGEIWSNETWAFEVVDPSISIINIIDPNGEELFEGGAMNEINWSSTGLTIDHISLFYSIDGGITFSNITEAMIPNNGIYFWDTPNILAQNTKIKIQALDSQNNLLAEDTSDENFTIGFTIKTNFAFERDNYYFSNLELYNHMFKPLLVVLKNSNLLKKFFAIISILSKFTSVGGNCLGMSISSTIYFVDPYQIPVTGKTTWELTPEEAEDDITSYQSAFALDCVIPGIKTALGIPITYMSNLNYLEDWFSKNHPSEIYLAKSGYPGGHVVVATKLVDFGNKKRVYIYDVNLPTKSNRYLELIKLPDNSYYFSGYRGEEYFFDRFEPFNPIEDPVEPDEFWTLFWRWFSEIIKDLFNSDKILFSLNCPADALIKDNFGRRIGMLNGVLINEIPDAEVLSTNENELYKLPNNLEYNANIVGNDAGKFYLNIIVTDYNNNNQLKSVNFNDIPTEIESKASVVFNRTFIDSTIKIDINNDGFFEDSIASNNDTIIVVSKPNAPFHLKATSLSLNAVSLSWQDNNSDKIGFIIERKDGHNNPYNLIANVSSNAYSYVDSIMVPDITYYYRIATYNFGGYSDYSNEDSVNVMLGIDCNRNFNLPNRFELSQNYPNPFNSQTTIHYQLPQASHVIIKIYNIMGHEIIKLVDENKNAGIYTANWKGKDWLDREVTSGVYFYKIEAINNKVNSFTSIKKMLYLK